jgi:hypothetical protein
MDMVSDIFRSVDYSDVEIDKWKRGKNVEGIGNNKKYRFTKDGEGAGLSGRSNAIVLVLEPIFAILCWNQSG